jgi:hypothetical protein
MIREPMRTFANAAIVVVLALCVWSRLWSRFGTGMAA